MIFKRKVKDDIIGIPRDSNFAPDVRNILPTPLLPSPDSIIMPQSTTENLSDINVSEESSTIQKKAQSKSIKTKRRMKAKMKESDNEEDISLFTPAEVRSRGGKRRFKSRKIDDFIGISGEEEKLMMIAIKNSLRETQINNSIPLNEIEEMKVYRPTEEEFLDPIQYVEKLYKEEA